MRLRTVLALVFAGSALVLTFIGTLTVSRFVAARAQIRAEARMADLSGQLRHLIEANIAERLNDMQVLTSVAGSTATTPQARRTWVEALRTAYPAYAWIGFADRDGLVTASTGGLLEGVSVATRPWFRSGLEGPSVSDVHEALLLARALPELPHGEPRRFVDVSAPLRDGAGSVTGVVGGHLSLPWLRELSRAAVAPVLARDPSVEVLILAGDGTVVLGPGDRQGERMLGDLPAIDMLAAGAEEATARGVWPDGHDYFTGASRTRISVERPSLPWSVMVRQRVDVALAPTRSFVFQLATGGAAFALLSAFLGWLAAERLARPLHALVAAAIRIGDVADVRLPRPRGYIEIKELTDALGALLARLGERDRALASVNAELERRVADRTAELVDARDRAEAAQAHAEAGERAKGEFLATMSHEIRTPLNAIKGFSDLMLQDAALTTGQRQHLGRVRTACSVLITVVNDILDLARVESGRIELEQKPFSPRTLIEETVALLQGLAEDKGLTSCVDIDPDLPPYLKGDAVRLGQVLLNLLNNAIKFTAKGSVTVRAGYVEQEIGAYLHVVVEDTGIGIPATVQARLFERFSQADSGTARRYGGSGLGLAIAKGLVDAMGGRIALVSYEGRGAAFSFSVPLARAECQAAEAPAMQDGGLLGSFKGRLLLVDDSEVNREVARAVLERGGYAVDTVASGPEALSAVTVRRYDLVLMDVQMPGMDGIAATRAIRALADPARDVPIVAMTANVLPEQVAGCRAAGMVGHVGKPFEQSELFAAVERWIGRDDGPGTSRAILDRAAFDAMAELVGRDRMDELLAKLAEELAHWLATSASVGARDELARQAHQLVSSAGVLGFTELARLCMAVERACVSSGDYEAPLAAMRVAAAEAIGQIDSMLAA